MLCLTLEQHPAAFSYYARSSKKLGKPTFGRTGNDTHMSTGTVIHGATPPLKIPVRHNFSHPICSQHFGAIGSCSLSVPPNKIWDLWATLYCCLIQVWVREHRQNIIWFHGFVLFFPSSQIGSTGGFLLCGYLLYRKDIKLGVMLDQ